MKWCALATAAHKGATAEKGRSDSAVVAVPVSLEAKIRNQTILCTSHGPTASQPMGEHAPIKSMEE